MPLHLHPLCGSCGQGDHRFGSGPAYEQGPLFEAVDATPQPAVWNWQFDKAGNRINEQLATSAGIRRQAYSVNIRDQVESIASGGAVHVKGQLDRPGMIEDATPPEMTPTDAAGHFAAWIPTSSLTSATVTAHDFSSNTTSKAVAINAVDAPVYTFEYDANGNMTEMTETRPGHYPRTTYYTWDALDRLVLIESDLWDVTYLTYDGLGRMRSFVDSHLSMPETYFTFTWNGLSRVKKDGAYFLEDTEVTYFQQGFDYNSYWETYADSGKYYITKDHLGSTRGVYDAQGNEVDAFSYDAYGNFDRGTFASAVVDDYFTGHLYHAVSGLYLAPYRAYNPKIGRWLSREPLGLDGPNLYHYVFNDLMNYIDSTGLEASPAINVPNQFPRGPITVGNPGKPVGPSFPIDIGLHQGSKLFGQKFGDKFHDNSGFWRNGKPYETRSMLRQPGAQRLLGGAMTGFWIGLFEPTTLGRGTLPVTYIPAECPPPPFTYLTNPPVEYSW